MTYYAEHACLKYTLLVTTYICMIKKIFFRLFLWPKDTKILLFLVHSMKRSTLKTNVGRTNLSSLDHYCSSKTK